ncbi:MAG: putative glycoside hydrolase [Dethiobacteria bacterium]
MAWLFLWQRKYIQYGAAQIREQIDAAMALGIDEYMLWDANNENYPREAFFTEEKRLPAATNDARQAREEEEA